VLLSLWGFGSDLIILILIPSNSMELKRVNIQHITGFKLPPALAGGK
jgi:hypothetical protein